MKHSKQHFKIILLVLTLFFICTNQNAIVYATPSVAEQPSDNEDNGSSTEDENEPEDPDITVLDKTALEEQIAAAEAILPNQNSYTTSTYNAMITVLNTSKQIYTNENSSQQEIDTACTNLKNAINALELLANKTALKQLMDTAATYKKWLYTSATYKKVTTALKNAQKVYDNPQATQKEADQKMTALKNAIDGLQPAVQPRDVKGDTYYYNICDFGASGSDSKDDRSAIQAALDTAGSDHKIVVLVPNGKYYISGTLYIQSNTILQLSNNATIYRSNTDSNMLMVSNNNHKTTTFYGYTLGHDITVTGGTWDGGKISKLNKEKYAHDLIYIGHSENISISNTTIKNCYGAHALEFAGVKNASINKCTFTGFRYDPSRFTSEAVQLDICDKNSSDGSWAPGYTIDGTTCKNITISNNKFIDYPRGIGCHHLYSTGANRNGKFSGPYENIIIKNNTFKRSSASKQYLCSSGIFIIGAKKIQITNNTVDKYDYGIWVKNSSQITLKKNNLKYNTYANIIYSGNTGKKNATIKFTVTQDQYKTKKLVYTCPTIKTGYVKTAGKTYRFKKAASKHTVKLKKKLKRNQKMTFYGQDASGNKFYRTYYTPKKK